jgi:hypothetical protein
VAEIKVVCCDELRSALAAAFLNPLDGSPGWILYGTDHESVIAGEPELRYWPVRFCPFCGAPLPGPSIGPDARETRA